MTAPAAPKSATHAPLAGPVLFLSTDTSVMAAQMAGQSVTLAQAGTLRDDVSTDEITPVAILSHDDDKLARYPHTGLRVGGGQPV